MNDLDRTREQLANIPALAAKLPQFLTGTTATDEGGRRPVPGSKPPLSVDLIDLIDGREIDNWVRLAFQTMDEISSIQFAGNWQARKQWLNEHPSPEGWNENDTKALKANCDWLSKHADWIESEFPDPEPIKQHATPDPWMPLHCGTGHYLTKKRIRTRGGKQLCDMCPTGFSAEIEALHWAYRRAAREMPGPKMACLKCGNPAFVADGWMVCQEVQEHQRTVKSIEMDYRRRLPLPTDDLMEEFHISPEQLREWTRTGKLHPYHEDHKTGQRGRPRRRYYPWDVFLLKNPAIAEVIERRDMPA